MTITKAIGSLADTLNKFDDVTLYYKFKEGTQKRTSFNAAFTSLGLKLEKVTRTRSRNSTLSLNIENVERLTIGQAIKLSYSIINNFNEMKTVKVLSNLSSIYYTGELYKHIASFDDNIELEPKQGK